jgi:hypothetical protein
MTEPVFRTATAADDAGIRSLLARNFPDNVKALAPFTRWQYWDNPFGETVSIVAEVDGRIAAHWAAVPVPMVLGGREQLGAKGVDGATDPDQRGRGLFAGVGARMLAAAGEAGIGAILTHPNPDAARGAEKAGAVLISRAAAHVRPVDHAWVGGRLRLPGPLARPVGAALRRVAFRLSAGDPVELDDRPPLADLDGLWARAGAHVENGIARHAAWWDWRYARRPERPYTFAVTRRGGAVTGAACVTVAERFGGRFGLVLEHLAVDAEAMRGLTRGLDAIARAHGAVGLALATLPGSRESALVTGAGFRRLPQRLEPRPLRMMVFDPDGDAAGLAARRWAMAWGDLDHI